MNKQCCLCHNLTVDNKEVDSSKEQFKNSEKRTDDNENSSLESEEEPHEDYCTCPKCPEGEAIYSKDNDGVIHLTQEPMEWAKEKITPYKTDLKSIQCKHSYLRNNFGKATFCMNELCEKKSKRFEWCKKTECEYTFNPDDYIWLCRSCHRKYDLTPEKKEKAIKNLWWKFSPTAPNTKGINQYTNGKPHIGRRNV